MLYLRIATGLFLHLFAPGYSSCGRCRMPWKFTKEHSTLFTVTQGMFPLDEWCWKKLTPAERLPYYRKLWTIWMTEFNSIENWSHIESAVLKGL